MDDQEKTAALVRRNRVLLEQAAAARTAAREATAEAAHALWIAARSKIERERRNALRRHTVKQSDAAR